MSCMLGKIPVCGGDYDLFPDIRFDINGTYYYLPRESYVVKTNELMPLYQIRIMTNE